MEQTVGCALILAIAGALSFYAARWCLHGVLYLIHRTVHGPSRALRPDVSR